MSDAVKYIQPPNNLRKKQIDAGVQLHVNLATIDGAEKKIGDMKESYLKWVVDDLAKLAAATDAALADKANRVAHVETLYMKASEMKGQGSSFGYPLMTSIGSQLCRFIETTGNDVTDVQMGVVKLHVETMRLVIQQKMEGDGGAAGQKLVTGLNLALKKVIGG